MNYPREEKVAEGIYLTKPLNKLEQKDCNKDNINKYVFKSTAELINILECEFEHSLSEIKLLHDANEEMIEFDPNDYDLIQAREDNIVIINKRINRMKEIQDELRKLCPTNPVVLKDVFDHIKDFNKNQNIGEIINNQEDIYNEQNDEAGVKKQEEILTSIQL